MPDFYYNSLKNVKDYIKMARPYDGKILTSRLKYYLTPGSSILELGMGPGKDMDMLLKDYRVTGTDLSPVFIELYRKKNPDADLQVLDIKKMNISRRFDCVYSNKVLHHLSSEELGQSLEKQTEILNPGGLVLHSFWEGDREEILSGLTFRYYRLEQLKKIFSDYFTLLELEIYSEVFPDDSIWVIGRRKNN